MALRAGSTTKTIKCELVHTDVGGPLTESLGGSIYFITALEDSTGFITATPIRTKGMALQVLKTRIKQLETLTGVHIKRVRHDGAKEYLTNDLKTWYEDKAITSEMTAPYKAQMNGKAERVNSTLMERVCKTPGLSRHVEPYFQHFAHFKHHFPRGTLPS